MTTEELLKKATARPWVADTSKPYQFVAEITEIPRVRMNGACDALIASLGATRKEQEANAELIVRAVNSFEAMREALQLVHAAMWADVPPRFRPAMDAVNKALDLANSK